MSKTREIVFPGLFTGGMSIAMFFSPVWYFIPILMGIYISLWYRGKTHREYLVPALFCGEISCAASWYSSPWLAWMVQVAIFGIFLQGLKIPDTQQERMSLIAICGSLALITYLTDQVNHTFIIILTVICASVLTILYILTVDYRLKKRYSGEKI